MTRRLPRGPAIEILLAAVLVATVAVPATAVDDAPSGPQEATRAAGGGQEGTTGVPPTPDSVVIPDSAVVTGARLDEMTARLASKLRCPVCRNQSVLESSSTLAREMQAEIKRRIARGESPEEVKAYFVSRYGEWVLLKPKAEGINLLVYLLPGLALVGGGLVVWRLLDRWTGPSEEASPAPDPAADAGRPEDVGLSEDEEERLESVLSGEDDAGA